MLAGRRGRLATGAKDGVSDERAMYAARPGLLGTAGAPLVPVRDETDPAGLPATVPSGMPSCPPVTGPDRTGPARWRRHFRLATVLRGMRHDLALEIDRGLLFLGLPLGFGSGAALYFALAVEPDLSALVSGACVLSLLVWLARDRARLKLILAAALTVICGMTAAKLETGRGAAVTLGSAVTTTLTGRVVMAERLAGGRMRLIVETATSQGPRLRYLPETIRITTRAPARMPLAGDGVRARVRLMPPPGPVRPGGYDFSFESHFDGIGAIGFVFGTPEFTSQDGWPGLQARLERMRHALAERIRWRIPGQNGEIAAALVTGYKGSISESNTEALRTSGLAHILAISGLHMALVAGTVAGGLRAVMAAFPGFAARHPVRKHAALAALLAVTGYLLISGGAVATRRSHVMLAVMLLALHADRMALTMRNIAIAALVILAWNPHEIIGPGFQMSFAATAALVAAYGAVQQRRLSRQAGRLQGPAGWPLRVVAALLFTSLIAGAATGLYGAFHFQRYAPLGPVANLLAMPVVSLVVMPSALIAHLMMIFDLDGPFFRLMGEGIGIVLHIARAVSERTGADGTGTLPQSTLILATIGLVLLTVLTTRLRLLAIPFFLAAILACKGASVPDGWMADDGKTLALRTPDGALAFSRNRVSGFIRENWSRAAKADTVRLARQGAGPSLLPLLASTPTGAGDGFVCDGQLCLAAAPRGWIVQTGDPDVVRKACATARLILYSKAAGAPRCTGRRAAVIVTYRDLALAGSAAFRLNDKGRGVAVDFAVPGPYRPWHRYRQWSRQARGLEEWKPAGDE